MKIKNSIESGLYFLNFYKPCNMSSFDCIRMLRRVLKIKKIGHMGTLDPLAEGVLPVAIGKGTKLIQYVQGGIKIYQTVFQLGFSTDTDDIEGTVIKKNKSNQYSIEKITNEINSFIGEVEQYPPRVSAVHVNGKRAYELVRKGKDFILESRKVRIYSIEILSYRFPYIELIIKTGPGTYIRSIARDLGEQLGCGGIVLNLKRLKSGSFKIDETFKIDEIKELYEKGDVSSFLIKPFEVMNNISILYIRDSSLCKIANGVKFNKDDILGIKLKEDSNEFINKNIMDVFMVVDSNKNIVAIAKKEGDNIYLPKKVFI